MTGRPALALALSLAAGTAAADGVVLPCEGWRASVGNLLEPLDRTTRAFAGGRVRVLVLGHGEPACCGTWIAVLHPTPEGFAGCSLILATEDRGWADAGFAGDAYYDLATGLSVPMDVVAYDGAGGVRSRIVLLVNQAEGRVTLR